MEIILTICHAQASDALSAGRGNYGVFVFLVRCRLYVLLAMYSFGFMLDPGCVGSWGRSQCAMTHIRQSTNINLKLSTKHENLPVDAIFLRSPMRHSYIRCFAFGWIHWDDSSRCKGLPLSSLLTSCLDILNFLPLEHARHMSQFPSPISCIGATLVSWKPPPTNISLAPDLAQKRCTLTGGD